MNKTIFSLLIAAVCVGASLIGALTVARNLPQPSPQFGNVEPPFTKFNNTSGVNVTTSSTQVIGTSTGRRFVMLQNTSGTQAVYCAVNGNPGIDQQGFVLIASSTLRFPLGSEPTYAGGINCIASSTVKILVNEAY